MFELDFLFAFDDVSKTRTQLFSAEIDFCQVDSEVWRLAVAEFKKPESKMEMEISLLSNYFGGQDSKDLALPPKQPVAPDCAQELMDAFHAHMVAGIFWDFDTEERGELDLCLRDCGRNTCNDDAEESNLLV